MGRSATSVRGKMLKYEDGGRAFQKDSNRNKSQTKANVSRNLQSASDLEDFDDDELNEMFS